MQTIELRKEKHDFRTNEALKTLRTNIEFAGEDIQVIGLTSATPNEGKSTISMELAKSFAENGSHTLLIDADMRKSVMRARQLHGNIRYGLTNILARKTAIEDAICVSDFDNLEVIFAGPVPPNPSELLGGKHFGGVIEYARSHYDCVIIDAPPIGSVIDAAVIARKCDGMLIVIESGAISYRFEKKVVDQLKVADARILGVVLNKINIGGKGYYGRYYGKYYERYYGKYYGQYYGTGNDNR
ncbi:MAG: polysaccharide biosynthesis tyrosine autokinase [Lachnospiraceae bacterium]|nr:polysaccharide biosynthesis tyrosine autokinase [Lachnospiraceae bacterium]